MNAVEREPVPTRVFNPNASEASYKPKERSYRKTKLKKKILRFPVTTLFRFVDRFARGKSEDSSRNRFALNGIKIIACFIVFSS